MRRGGRRARRRCALASLSLAVVISQAAPASAQVPGHTKSGPCRCGALACGFVLEAHGVGFAEGELAPLDSPSGSHMGLDALATVLRSRGLQVDVRRVTPTELVREARFAILPIHHPAYGGGTHYETFVGSNSRQAHFAAPASASSGQLVIRSFDNLARVWTGEALIVNGRAPGSRWAVSKWIPVLPLALGGVCVGWLAGSYVLRRRKRATFPTA